MPYRFLVSMKDAGLGESPSFAGLEDFLRKRASVPGRAHICQAIAADSPDRGALRAGGLSSIPWMTLVLGAETLEMPPHGAELHGIEVPFAEQLAGKLGVKTTNGPVIDTAGFVKTLVEDRVRPPKVARGKTRRGEGPVWAPYELLLVHAAACLNDVYFRAKADQQRAVSRWGEDTVNLKSGSGGASGADPDPALETKVNDLRERLSALAADLKVASNAPTPLRILVDRIRGGVDETYAPVSVADLQAITEVAWHVLVRSSKVYPGWPDLLVSMSLDPEARPIRQGHPRPSFTKARGAEIAIANLLSAATNETRRLYASNRLTSTRMTAYHQFADLLAAQAQFRTEVRQGYSSLSDDADTDDETDHDAPLRPEDVDRTHEQNPKAPPPAVAFVTTFDVELEMALRFYHRGQPFVVAVPVNLVDILEGMKQRATSMWLGYVVRAADDQKPTDLLTAVTKPEPEDWFVLSSATIDVDPGTAETNVPARVLPADVRSLADLPFIVRLSGSPLVELPDVGLPGAGGAVGELRSRALRVAYLAAREEAAPAKLADGGEATTGRGPSFAGSPADAAEAAGAAAAAIGKLDTGWLSFAHAPLLEEHHSLRLSLPEVVANSQRGLPRVLTDGVDEGYWRYWTFVGVQLSDSVIRYRLIAQLIGAGLLSSRSPGDYRRPGHTGIAVNRERLSARAADLLLWSEFDIVTSDCAALTPEIEHYTKHLAALRSKRSWPTEQQRCDIP